MPPRHRRPAGSRLAGAAVVRAVAVAGDVGELCVLCMIAVINGIRYYSLNGEISG